MNTIDQTYHSIEDEFPTIDVTDEALESAAGTEATENFTQGVCTALTACREL